MLDVLYAPWPTPLAQRVLDVCGTVVGGLEVLFWQATVQVELMTGQPAPIGAMRARARRRRRPALSRPWSCPGRCCSAPPWCSPSSVGPWLAGVAARLAAPGRRRAAAAARGPRC